MPKMDGFETLRRVRNKKITVDAIMVTAINDRASLDEALHLGIVDYLVKPFTFDRFQMALEKYISQNNALKYFKTLNQKNIDHIIDNTRKKSYDFYPKGIQEKTVDLIVEYLKANEDKWFTGDDIAEKACLTDGRPCMKYRIS